MNSYRILYRFLGIFWIFVGVLILIISLTYILAYTLINSTLIQDYPQLRTLGQLMWGYPPPLLDIAGLLFSAFCILIGNGLLKFKGWARTVGVAFHWIMSLCLAVLVFTLYTLMTNPDPQLNPNPAPELVAGLFLAFGLLVAAGLAVIAYQLSTDPAMKAFASSQASTPNKPVKAVCPTCGGPLNLTAGNCDRCDTPPSLTAPLRARLMDTNGKEYTVSTRMITRIGRDQPGYEIQLNEPSVSHEHAWIEFSEGMFILHPLNDTNGTFVNDMEQKVRDTEIRHEDIIAFGRAQFRFMVEDR